VNKENTQDAFLGINKEENGNVIFSSVYCKQETKNSQESTNNSEKEEQKPVKTMGIKKDNIPHISPFKMYSYNEKCSDLGNDSNLWKAISAMNMSDLRQGFKSTMESFVTLNTYEKVDKTNSEDVMKSQINNFMFPFKTIILLILALLVIIITIISGCLNGYTHNKGGIIGGIWGSIYGLIDAIPYSIYSLGFVFFPYLTQTREDFFGKGKIMEDAGKFSYPNFIDYLCSKGNSYILMIWSIATIFTLSLSTTNFEFNSYSITSIVIGLFGLSICLYNTIMDLCNSK